MNKDDIIRMAREAGLLVIGTADGGEAVYTWPQGITEELERFASLVASAERERIIAANAPEIEAVNAHIKALEDAVAAEPLSGSRLRLERT